MPNFTESFIRQAIISKWNRPRTDSVNPWNEHLQNKTIVSYLTSGKAQRKLSQATTAAPLCHRPPASTITVGPLTASKQLNYFCTVARAVAHEQSARLYYYKCTKWLLLVKFLRARWWNLSFSTLVVIDTNKRSLKGTSSAKQLGYIRLSLIVMDNYLMQLR